MKSTFSKIALAVFSLGLLWSCDVEEFDPSVSVESVTLSKQTLQLVVGQRDSLVATVLPENASDKSVVWTSSADSVVTVSDGLLEALSIGNATITVTTVDGEKTAQCAVTVLSAAQSGSLTGMFSVADGRRIRFAEGNLRFALADSTWGFYSEQYLCGPAVYTAGHNAEISLFTWGYGAWSVSPDTKSHSTAYAEDGASLANSDDWGAALAGTGSWRTLTNDEWNHILQVREGAADKCKYGVSVCGQPNCLVIAPDNFTGTIEESYTQQTWAAAEQNDGLVCLPAAGVRNGDVTTGVGENGHYWTATSAAEGKALSISTKSAPAMTSRGASKLAAQTGRRDLAPVSSEVRPTNTSVNVEQPRNYVADLNKALKKSNSFKRETQSATVSNSKQQSVQKEPVVKVLDEKKFQKAENANAKRGVANARGSRPAIKSTSGIKPLNTSITIGTFNASTAYEGEYYVVMTDAASTTQFIFDIVTDNFELGKTYTIADMNERFTGIGDSEDWYAWTIVTDASYTETKDQDGLTHVVASMTYEDGIVYDITYDQLPPQSKTIVASDFSMEDYETDMFFILTDSVGNQFRFDVLYTGSFEFDKTYTLADMDSDYSWYKLATGGGLTYTEASFTITEDKDELLHVVAAVVLNNGDSYEITYDEKAFEPSGKQIEVNGTDLNGRYMSAYGFYLYTAKWGDYTVQLAFDAEEEKAAYTNDDFIADYGLIYLNSEKIQLLKLASDNITITNTETTKTLAGSVYAKNGDEYVLNLVYEKPDAKYIGINVKDANLTNKTAAGFWTIDGQTADKNNSFNIYFISKALQGTWTDVKKFDSYSTWVSDKSTGSNVYYENISAVNLTSVVDGDSLKITGTMNLADANGNPAIVTVYITTPFTQTWGEWADFAPFDKNTGKYTFATLGAYTQSGVQVQERKDNTGLKQYNLKSWGKGYLDGVGMDLILNMNPDYTFSFVSDPINMGADIYFADVATAYNNPAYASFNSYDPETGVFSFYTAIVYAEGGSVYTAAKESLVMDKPITQRDTVDIVSTALNYNDLIASNKVVIYYAADVPDYYLFRVTSNNATSVDGTFKWSDGTINDPNSYFSVTGTDKNYFQDGEFTVATEGKNIALKGWMIGTDEKYYRLDMSYTAPTQRDTLRFSGKGVTISECVSSQTGVQTGWFYELADASTGYEFLLQSTVVAEKYGTFTYEDKTLGSNYYNVFDPQGNRQQFVEGSITVGEVGDSLVLNGVLVAQDEKVYVLHFTQPAGVLAYDSDAPFDATFAWSDMDASITEGVIGIHATNAEGRTIGLELYADPAATEIPAGVYTISDSQEAGTALKSLGVAGGYLTECFAGTRAANGGISDCWFLVEGTITLSYDEYGKLNVEVDATNSCGQPVKAKVTYEFVAVDPLLRENGYSVRLVSDVE